MAIKKYKPITPGQRGMTVSAFDEITKTTPEKSLTVTLKKHSGRNVRGKITVRRLQTEVQNHRLQETEGRYSGQGFRNRIRSEQKCKHRSHLLR